MARCLLRALGTYAETTPEKSKEHPDLVIHPSPLVERLMDFKARRRVYFRGPCHPARLSGAMLLAMLESAPEDLWKRSPAPCPVHKVMLLYAASKRVRALVRKVRGALPLIATVKGDYTFNAESTPRFLRELRALPDFCSLTGFYFIRDPAHSVPERVVMKALCALEHVQTIEVLCLDGNGIGTQPTVTALGEFLGRQSQIHFLSLVETGIGSLLPVLCASIASQTHTKTLDLTSTGVNFTLGRLATSALGQGAWFSTVFGALRSLDLSLNNLTSQMDALLTVMVGLPVLTNLTLKSTWLRDADGLFFFFMLAGAAIDNHEFAREFAAACPALECLDMRMNRLDLKSCRALSRLLTERPLIRYVDMRDNYYSPYTFSALDDFFSSGRVGWAHCHCYITDIDNETTFDLEAPYGMPFWMLAEWYFDEVPDSGMKYFFLQPGNTRVGYYSVVGLSLLKGSRVFLLAQSPGDVP